MSSYLSTLGYFHLLFQEIEPSFVNIDYIKQALQAVINHEKTRTKEPSGETDGEQPVATTETDTQTTDDDHLKIKAARLQAGQSGCKIIQTTTVNNFSKFLNAFKGYMVNSCRRGFDKICSDKKRQRERKRHHPSNQFGDDQNVCGHLPEDFETGLCSKYAKHEDESTKKKILISGCEDDGQDINSKTTNTEKQGLQISTVERLSFQEYLVFLKKEFDNDEIECGSVDTSSGHDVENKIVDTFRDADSVVVGSSSGDAVSVFDENTGSISSRTIYSCIDSSENIAINEQKRINRSKRDGAKSCSLSMEDDGKNGGHYDRFALQVINSVLDHTVVSGVCQNLLKKYKG